MSTAELTSDHVALLQGFSILEQRNAVPTVHAASNVAGITFMRTFDLINELFSAGMLTHDLRLTDAGRKAATAG